MADMQQQRALQGCSRALAQSANCPQETVPGSDWAMARYRADKNAFFYRYHDPALHRLLRPAERDLDTAYLQIEKIRCFVLGARQYPGVAENIQELINQQEVMTRNGRLQNVLLRYLLDNVAGYRPAELAAAALTELKSSLSDQRQFAEVLFPVLKQWLDNFNSDQQAHILKSKGEQEDKPSLFTDLFTDFTDDDLAADETDASDSASLSESEAGANHPLFRPINMDYRVLTRNQDRLLQPARLVSLEQYQQLKAEFTRLLPDQQRVVRHLARRLQRHIMARQQRHWLFSRDEGLLDTARLTRIVLHPGNPLAYKQEQEGEFPSTAVTLLVDNSGSMRGLPILHAALCIDVLVKTLEQCHISTEVLGYTTTHWQEQALEHWAKSGKPEQPGRLNGLQHLVFKSASQRWRDTQHGLGWLLQQGDMRENIDGEALQWAASRLLARPEKRKILIVLADGAPHDEATQAANGRGLLEQHLQQVSQQLDCHSEVDLLGIGLGHDLSRYYSRSAVIHRAEQMAEILIAELDGLLVQDNDQDRSRTRTH